MSSRTCASCIDLPDPAVGRPAAPALATCRALAPQTHPQTHPQTQSADGVVSSGRQLELAWLESALGGGQDLGLITLDLVLADQP